VCSGSRHPPALRLVSVAPAPYSGSLFPSTMCAADRRAFQRSAFRDPHRINTGTFAVSERLPGSLRSVGSSDRALTLSSTTRSEFESDSPLLPPSRVNPRAPHQATLRHLAGRSSFRTPPALHLSMREGELLSDMLQPAQASRARDTAYWDAVCKPKGATLAPLPSLGRRLSFQAQARLQSVC